jgi:hypothetical protein
MEKSGEIAVIYNEFLLISRQERWRVAWLDYGDCSWGQSPRRNAAKGRARSYEDCKLQLSGNQSRQKGEKTSVSVQARLCGSAGRPKVKRKAEIKKRLQGT